MCRWTLGTIERRCGVTVLLKPLTLKFFLGPDCGNSNILLLILKLGTVDPNHCIILIPLKSMVYYSNTVPLNGMLYLIIQLLIVKLGTVNPNHGQACGEDSLQLLYNIYNRYRYTSNCTSQSINQSFNESSIITKCTG